MCTLNVMETKVNSKILLTVFFVVLLASPFIISNYGKWTSDLDSTLNRESALERFGFYMEDVTAEWAVDFTHQVPSLDPRLNHIMPQIASVGASVSIADFNNDGLQDFYVTSSAHGSHNGLYKNLGDG